MALTSWYCNYLCLSQTGYEVGIPTSKRSISQLSLHHSFFRILDEMWCELDKFTLKVTNLN
jgi:hypothetical protein